MLPHCVEASVLNASVSYITFVHVRGNGIIEIEMFVNAARSALHIYGN